MSDGKDDNVVIVFLLMIRRSKCAQGTGVRGKNVHNLIGSSKRFTSCAAHHRIMILLPMVLLVKGIFTVMMS